MTDTSNSSLRSDLRRPKLRHASTVMLVALMVQFLVGMIVNLFVSVPTGHPGAGSGPYLTGAIESVFWSFSSGLPLLIVHVVLGIVIFAYAIRVIVDSLRAKRTAAQWLASLGASAVVFAAFNGASFLKFNENLSSMLMSAGFALAIVCYTLLLSLS